MRRLWRLFRDPYLGPAEYRLPGRLALYVDIALSSVPLPRVEVSREVGSEYVGVSFGPRYSDAILSLSIQRDRGGS